MSVSPVHNIWCTEYASLREEAIPINDTTILPGVTKAMLSAEFWTADLSDTPPCAREAYHEQIRPSLNDLSINTQANFALPEQPGYPLFQESGEEVDGTVWDTLVALASAPEQPMTPGFTVRRSDLRRWPTAMNVFKSPVDKEFDQFQETSLHTFDPVLVHKESLDGQWLYVTAAIYKGWVRKDDVALCSWDTFAKYQHPTSFIVVTRPFVLTQPQPYDMAVSCRALDFAAIIPISEEVSHLGRQTQFGNVPILLPVRNERGELDLHQAFVRQTPDIHVGWQPLTRKTAIETAFALLYERYGWGGRLGTHDCSSFIMDIYRTMGVHIPRDANQQEAALPAVVTFTDAMTEAERQGTLSRLLPGDPVYMPGHTMMYLGEHQSRHYVIHGFAGFVEGDADIAVNEVMVSTLDIQTKRGATLLQLLTKGCTLFTTDGER